jgi:hypothetical protein
LGIGTSNFGEQHNENKPSYLCWKQSVGSSLLEAVFYNNTLGFHLFLSFVLVIMSTASKVVVLEESPVKVHSPSKLYNTVLDWVPLVGILVLHLVLGICVDNWKEGKSLLIEEILAR